jgi:SAM-dependent methyltransferase
MGLTVKPINLLQVGSHFIPAVREKLGTSIQNPPEGIHRMQKDEPRYIGDIYSANMILSSLARLGWNIEKGKRYLDFGCSSGSLIRMFKAYEPGAEFHGIDPIPSSIEWANANIPGAYFQVSNPLPPAPHQSETFDGMTAVSIWSHLGEQEALAWFEELRRCLKPGGWLCFTTHGMISVHRYCQVKILPEKRVKAILEGLYNSNFAFEEVYIGESPEGLSATGYGNTYFTREWVTSNLSGGWDVLSYEPGMNQSNQDIYVLQKR